MVSAELYEAMTTESIGLLEIFSLNDITLEFIDGFAVFDLI